MYGLAWKDCYGKSRLSLVEEGFEVHKNSEHFARLGELKAEFVENTEFMKFSAEQI